MLNVLQLIERITSLTRRARAEGVAVEPRAVLGQLELLDALLGATSHLVRPTSPIFFELIYLLQSPGLPYSRDPATAETQLGADMRNLIAASAGDERMDATDTLTRYAVAGGGVVAAVGSVAVGITDAIELLYRRYGGALDLDVAIWRRDGARALLNGQRDLALLGRLGDSRADEILVHVAERSNQEALDSKVGLQ